MSETDNAHTAESCGPNAPGACSAGLLGWTAFATGAALMTVELAGSRVLAPAFGMSLYTWTALIGVIMIALSLGSWSGGVLADACPRHALLAHLVAAAAVLVGLVPLLGAPVLRLLATEGREIDLVAGPVTATLLLFAGPGVLLGTASPFAVKLFSRQTGNSQVGRSAGVVSMLSTGGGVAGTFLAGFLLVPSVGVRAVFVVVSGVLAGTAAVDYIVAPDLTRTDRLLGGTLLVVSLLLGITACTRKPPPEPDTLLSIDSLYHRICVRQIRNPDGRRGAVLLLDGAPEGAQAEGEDPVVYEYNRYVRLAPLFCPSIDAALFLGGGAYTMPEILADEHPAARIDVVELDPGVEQVGRRFFRLDEYAARIRPACGDARLFLAQTSMRYDLIFGDCFRGRQSVPAHLATREFFALVRRRLTEDGVYMMNVLGAFEGPGAQFASAVRATMLQVFPEVHVFAPGPAGHATEVQNLIFVAPATPSGRALSQRLRKAGHDRELLRLADRLLPVGAFSTATDAVVLTDDYCPVELLVARQLFMR